MKKTKKTMAIATAFALGTLLVGCEPKTEQPQEVYGPPTSSTQIIPKDVESVYGPPTFTDEEKKTEKQTTEATTEYDPSIEVPEDVYGPPNFN